MRDFLIKYTAVPINFIDGHLKFYKMCEINGYGININDVIKYLDIKKKEKFMKRFREKFIKDFDYQVVYINKKKEKMTILLNIL